MDSIDVQAVTSQAIEKALVDVLQTGFSAAKNVEEDVSIQFDVND